MKERLRNLTFPVLAAVATLTSTGCLDTSWHVTREYPQCGAENKDPNKSIPTDHKVLVQIHSRVLTPNRMVIIDQGPDPACASRP